MVHSSSFVVLALAGLLAAGMASCRRAESPQFDARVPDFVHVFVDEQQIGVVTNANSLISLLREARFTPPHACIARGRFDLHYPDDIVVRVLIYPGHSPSRYEIAVGGKGYTVPRQELIDILTETGIDFGKMPDGS
jgi:hypothetical protein